MNYTINEDVASKHHLTINDVLLMMLIKNKCDIENNIESLLHRDIITKSALFNDIKLTQHWNEELQKVLLDSDKVIPKTNDLTYLVTTLRNIYPKGIKSGSAAWRGNVREITLRLQKFFKIYGSTYNEEDIIEWRWLRTDTPRSKRCLRRMPASNGVKPEMRNANVRGGSQRGA
jgi:hypothetical protein